MGNTDKSVKIRYWMLWNLFILAISAGIYCWGQSLLMSDISKFEFFFVASILACIIFSVLTWAIIIRGVKSDCAFFSHILVFLAFVSACIITNSHIADLVHDNNIIQNKAEYGFAYDYLETHFGPCESPTFVEIEANKTQVKCQSASFVCFPNSWLVWCTRDNKTTPNTSPATFKT